MNVAPGGFRYGAVLGAGGFVALLVHPLTGLALLGLAAGTVWFHRDPDRSVPDAGVLAPADGTVSVLRREADDRLRVGTFMNVHDVHVNRAPISGTVVECDHEPGAHRPAFSKDSDRNERVRLSLATDAGVEVEVVLIAGAFARRIHPYVGVEDRVERGERIGHISFGSRVDVLLPSGVDEADLELEVGEQVRAGESVLLDADVL